MWKIVWGIAAGIACQATAQLQPGSPWPMFRHDNRHTGTANTVVAPPGLRFWKYPGGDRKLLAFARDGTVYTRGAGDFELVAVRPDGTIGWRAPISSKGVVACTVSAEDNLFLTAYDFGVIALNSAGAMLWEFPVVGGVWASSAIGIGQVIYFGGEDGFFRALSSSGQLLWEHDTGAKIRSSPAISSEGTIVITNEAGGVFAFRPDGAVRWSAPATGKIAYSPAIDDQGNVYVSGKGNTLRSFDPDGALRWSRPIPGLNESPAIDFDGTAYISSFLDIGNTHLIAVESTGAIRWDVACSSGGVPAIAPTGEIYFGGTVVNRDGTAKHRVGVFPVFTADGVAYFSTYQGLYADRLAGKELWRKPEFENAENVSLGPDGSIYFWKDDGFFYSLTSDGNLRWKVVLPKLNAPAFVDSEGAILVPTYKSLNVLNQQGESVRELKGSFGTTRRRHDGTIIAVSGGSLLAMDDEWRLKWIFVSTLIQDFVLRDDGSMVAFGNDAEAGVVYSIDPAGNRLWGGDAQGVAGVACTKSGVTYVATHSLSHTGGKAYLSAIDSGGSLLWSIVDDSYVSRPVVGEDDSIYFGDGYMVYALTASGAVRWTFGDGNGNQFFIGSDGLLYLLDESRIIAFRQDGTPVAWSLVDSGSYKPALMAPDGTFVLASSSDLMKASVNTRTVTGAVELDALRGSPPLVAAGEIRDTATGEVWARIAPGIGKNGAFEVLAPRAMIDLSFKPTHWLRKTLERIDLRDGDATGLLLSLTNGDAVRDNHVDLRDLSAIFLVYGTADNETDLTNDGTIDLYDLTIVFSNYGIEGDN